MCVCAISYNLRLTSTCTQLFMYTRIWFDCFIIKQLVHVCDDDVELRLVCSAVRLLRCVHSLCVEAVTDWKSLIRIAADLNPDLSNTQN